MAGRKSKRTPIKARVKKTPPKKEVQSSPNREFPEVLHAEDGSTFYPCKSCCRAFANKPDLDRHFKVCSSGGRITPIPFTKDSPNSESENIKDDSTNLNGSDEVSERKSLNNNYVRSKRKRASSPDGTTSVITTNSASENINSLSKKDRLVVLESIKDLLKDTMITIEASKDGPIVVKTMESDSQPALKITSKNVSDNCVEIRTVRANGNVVSGEKMPDIADILENNFGQFRTSRIKKAFNGMDEIEFELDNGSVKGANSVRSSKHPRSITQVSEMDDLDFYDITLDDEEIQGTIVLEDLDIHICKQCGAVFHTLQDLISHDKYEHRNIKKRYPQNELDKFNVIFRASKDNNCPICFKHLSSRTAWPRHLQSHADVLKYECTICKRKFSRNDHRKLHEKRHVVTVKMIDD